MNKDDDCQTYNAVDSMTRNQDIPIDRDTLFFCLENGRTTPFASSNNFSGGSASSKLTLSQALDYPVTEEILDPIDGNDGTILTGDTNRPVAHCATSYFFPTLAGNENGNGVLGLTPLPPSAKTSHAQQKAVETITVHQNSFDDLFSDDTHSDDDSCGGDSTSSSNYLKAETKEAKPQNARAICQHEDDHRWNASFQELVSFRAIHGHCCVPCRFKSKPSLSRWVRRQRYQYKLRVEGKQGGIPDGRFAALEAIGFVWSAQGQKWQSRLNELVEYQSKHGHCNVPNSCRSNPGLANWVKNQRRQYKLFQERKPSNMNQHRINALNKLGFDWDPRL
eukprot:scaffold3914_cov121-Cylindrotheca_fusiformis.AAC.3